MKIKFLGAAREVTGSKHLITLDDGKKLLLDCGMYQGKGLETDAANKKLGFNPQEIDYLILSHAHIDHSGLIPYIVKLGFRGTIFCTNATRDLCAIMLADCGKIQEYDTLIFNKKLQKQGLPPVEPIYTKADAENSMQYFMSMPYNKPLYIDRNIKLLLTDTGHLLGGAVVNLEITENNKTTLIAYTGDIGRPDNLILKPPQPFPQADYLITEATYGNRLHDRREAAEEKLLKVVYDTCVKKKGKLIIPSFSIGRTQEIIYTLDRLKTDGKLPPIMCYVDSPLSFNATNIMRLHPECFNEHILKYMENDDDPFGFNNLIYIQSVDDSKQLNKTKHPCIIISASGMMEAGRVKHHLANSIDNPRNTVLVVGYCAPTTLGAKIVRGDEVVSIFGQEHHVRADVERIESYSGHGDYNEMINFLKHQDPNKIQKTFLVHGDYEAQEFYKQKLEENGFKHIEIPEPAQEFVL